MTAPWLAERLAGTPASLRTRIEDAVQAAGGDLRRAAEGLLDQSREGATRDSAMTLLAADALVTLACQWASEHDPDTLATL